MQTNNIDNLNLPAAISVTEMAKLLNLSRSRLYQLIEQNVFLSPVYSITTKRPFYTQQMAQTNIQVRRNNVGINNQVILFYCAKNNSVQSSQSIPVNRKQRIRRPEKQVNDDQYEDLIDGLIALGIEGINYGQIQAAVKTCFPDGTENIDKGEVLKQVFVSIKRQNSQDNVNR